MLRKTLRAVVAAGMIVAASAFLAGPGAEAQAAHPDLFYNYYVGPSIYGGVPAQMYVSPRPTPPLVGHTWITYQPLMPHELTYKHHRKYYRYYPNGGWNSTSVCWW